MLRIDKGRIELLLVTGFAEFSFSLDEKLGLITAVSVVAKQTLVSSYIGMRLLDDLTMFLVTTVAGLGLSLRQQWIIGRFMEGDVAFAATLIRVRLVGMRQIFGTDKIGMTLNAGIGLNQYGLTARLMRIMAEAALHVLIIGMGRR